MARSRTFKIERIAVVDAAGVGTTLTISIPVVTETTLDGSSFTYDELGTITDARGMHVNRKSDTEFEAIDGTKYRRVR